MNLAILIHALVAGFPGPLAPDRLPQHYGDPLIPPSLSVQFRNQVIITGKCPDYDDAVAAGLDKEEQNEAIDACWVAFAATASKPNGVIQPPPIDYLSREVRNPDGVIPNAPISERFKIYIEMYRCEAWKDYRYGRDDEQDTLDTCWDGFEPRS